MIYELFHVNKLCTVPVYSMRFFLRKEDVSALRPFKRFAFALVSLLSVKILLVIDRLRLVFDLTFAEGVWLELTVERPPLIIEIDDALEFGFSSVFCRLSRASMVVDRECRWLVSSLALRFDAGASRVEWRREYSSKLLSWLLLSIYETKTVLNIL